MLPNKDALDILKNMKQGAQTAHIPVIVLAGREDDAAEFPGIGHFVTKPFIPRDLLKRSLALLG